ncbi:alkaline phosphatase [Kribbella antibiotica]|uniref:Alkaline phosphatase n=2 Tax=Kribbella antibiotica TaxID=190195 RepID=A0A4R4ZHG1_9ACTN|nr:alkaline phosphatase [Kribbella antibiotica]
MLGAFVLVAGAGVWVALPGEAADSLLSRGKSALASSIEAKTTTADRVIDGNPATRWASKEGVDPQWIRVDLGGESTVHRVKLTWEPGYAKEYRLEVSSDGTTFTTLKTFTNQDGGTDDITGLEAHGRYVRVVGTKRATEYGYSLFEFEVYGTSDAVGDTKKPSVPRGLSSSAVTATSAELSWTASTDKVGVFGYDILRDGVHIASTTTPSYTDAGLTSEKSYGYRIRARDLADNVSGESSALTVKTIAGGAGMFVLAAAGDIAQQCLESEPACIHPKTAKVVEFIKPDNVLTMGDSQYDDAHLSDYNSYYAKTWGKFKDITKPVPGNHDTYAEPAYNGYDTYFGPAIAKPDGKRYYSWEKGNWHFIALDSTDYMPDDSKPGAAPRNDQLSWLKADLAKNTKGCVAAYFHHPRWSSGDHGDNEDSEQFWRILTGAKVDLVLNGHDHHYERFNPMNGAGDPDPNGTVEILGGMGGAVPYDLSPGHPATAKLLSTYGVVKLTMTDNDFTSQLIGLNNTVEDSSPTYTCRPKR